jgi:transposase
MLGPEKARDLDRPILTSLEQLVPSGNFYRQLDATLDLGFVRAWVEDRYAANGRPSIDPIVFFRLQLIMFFEGYRSERQLIEQASLNLAHRWYLGYHLDEELPDHSSLTRIRDRLGRDVFQRFFERVVELCAAAGLIWGKELFFDATRVRANADIDSLVPRLGDVVGDHIEQLFPRPEPTPDTLPDQQAASDAAGQAPEEPPPNVVSLPAAVSAPIDDAPWDLLEHCRLDPDRPPDGGYVRVSAQRVSTTDPDAMPVHPDGSGKAVLGYHDHYVVDGGRARIILQALVTPADVMENQAMLPLLRRVQFRWQLDPKRVVADTTYGTVENVRMLEESGIRAALPLRDYDDRQSDFLSARLFTYDAEHDQYRCPQGQPLSRFSRLTEREIVLYRAEAATCNACPLKAACTAGESGRTISRSWHEETLERVRAYHDTPGYAKAMRKRQVWPEPLFAEAKQWHGLRKFRLRGLEKVNMEGLLIAAGQNLKRWLAATGWGRRDAPSGSLTAPVWPSPALRPIF